MGKPHALRRVLAARGRVSSARTMSELAREYGVDRSTIFRWVKTGKIPRPGARARVKAQDTTTCNLPDYKVHTRMDLPDAKDWAAAVRAKYELSATENTLVDLGVAALAIANDAEQRPEVRLAAMGRYAALVKQLNLESEMEDGAVETVGRWPRRVG